MSLWLKNCYLFVYVLFSSTFFPHFGGVFVRWGNVVSIVDIINDAVATKKSEFFFVIRNLISGRANPFELDGGVNWLVQIQMLF